MRRWALLAMLLPGSDASAQSTQPAAQSVLVQTTPQGSSATISLKPDWTWNVDLTSPPSDGPLWKLDARTSLAAGRDTTFTFGVIGQRGYHLPTYMSESLASGGAAATQDASFVDALGRRNWDAHVRVQRSLFTTQRGTTFRAVGDVLIPLGRDDTPFQFRSMSALRSKAVRVGLVIGF